MRREGRRQRGSWVGDSGHGASRGSVPDEQGSVKGNMKQTGSGPNHDFQ